MQAVIYDIMTHGAMKATHFHVETFCGQNQAHSSKRIRIRQVTLKAPILERHIRRAEVSIRQRRTRSSRKTLPRNERLLTATRARETKSAM